MRDLSPGWATDLAILELTGSTIEDRGDHLVVRSPANPNFHWGNCLFVTDPGAVDDPARWAATFQAGFPEASWVAIGLVRLPDRLDAWVGLGLEVELDDVLTTETLPRQTPLAVEYTARRFADGDWERSVQRAIQENELTPEYEPQAHERFLRAQAQTRRSLSDHDDAAFFGAFTETCVLVAELGIVRCASTARYQSVGTDPDHRRRGLASHLLGLAARWAGERGCRRWVIVTEATNPAGLLYCGLGFELDAGTAQAYRPPPFDPPDDVVAESR